MQWNCTPLSVNYEKSFNSWHYYKLYTHDDRDNWALCFSCPALEPLTMLSCWGEWPGCTWRQVGSLDGLPVLTTAVCGPLRTPCSLLRVRQLPVKAPEPTLLCSYLPPPVWWVQESLPTGLPSSICLVPCSAPCLGLPQMALLTGSLSWFSFLSSRHMAGGSLWFLFCFSVRCMKHTS